MAYQQHDNPGYMAQQPQGTPQATPQPAQQQQQPPQQSGGQPPVQQQQPPTQTAPQPVAAPQSGGVAQQPPPPQQQQPQQAPPPTQQQQQQQQQQQPQPLPISDQQIPRTSGEKDTTHTKIFVGGLAWATTRESLAAYYEQYGPIEDAVVIMDRASGRSKGFGFVTFEDASAAEAACQNPNPVIDGRKANCNLAILGAKKKTPRPYRPYGGYGGGGGYNNHYPNQYQQGGYNPYNMPNQQYYPPPTQGMAPQYGYGRDRAPAPAPAAAPTAPPGMVLVHTPNGPAYVDPVQYNAILMQQQQQQPQQQQQQQQPIQHAQPAQGYGAPLMYVQAPASGGSVDDGQHDNQQSAPQQATPYMMYPSYNQVLMSDASGSPVLAPAYTSSPVLAPAYTVMSVMPHMMGATMSPNNSPVLAPGQDMFGQPVAQPFVLGGYDHMQAPQQYYAPPPMYDPNQQQMQQQQQPMQQPPQHQQAPVSQGGKDE